LAPEQLETLHIPAMIALQNEPRATGMRLKPNTHSISTTAAKNSRSATVPKLLTALNRCSANAEPS
jgi:hypothetical protein